jgi:hypothetical protein
MGNGEWNQVSIQDSVMGQLCCICGHVISDVSDQLPYVGNIYVLREQGDEQFWDELLQGVAKNLSIGVKAWLRYPMCPRDFTLGKVRRRDPV